MPFDGANLYAVLSVVLLAIVRVLAAHGHGMRTIVDQQYYVLIKLMMMIYY